jgi:hypothetical protein
MPPLRQILFDRTQSSSAFSHKKDLGGRPSALFIVLHRFRLGPSTYLNMGLPVTQILLAPRASVLGCGALSDPRRASLALFRPGRDSYTSWGPAYRRGPLQTRVEANVGGNASHEFFLADYVEAKGGISVRSAFGTEKGPLLLSDHPPTLAAFAGCSYGMRDDAQARSCDW